MSRHVTLTAGLLLVCLALVPNAIANESTVAESNPSNAPGEEPISPRADLVLVGVDPGAVQPAPPPGEPGPPPPAAEQGVPPLFTYLVTTSATDPNCVAPFANSGAYVDLAAFGIAPQGAVAGDGVAFVVDFAGGEHDLFGADQGELFYFTDDGFAFFDPSSPGGWPVNQPIPTADDPNNLLAAYWRDWIVVPGPSAGVSLANLTAGGVPVAVVVEYDDVVDNAASLSACCENILTPGCGDPICEAEVCALDSFCCNFSWDINCAALAESFPECGCVGITADFEIVAFYDPDPTPGAYEYLFAYDNLPADVSPGTIGIENAAGDAGVQYRYNDVDVTNGFAICFDLVSPPIAACQDVLVEADDSCTADASVDNGSVDQDGQAIVLTQDPPGPYPLGDTDVTLTVTDEQGATDSCTATVTVVDGTPPSLSVELTPVELWPPNHRMIDVGATVGAADTCGAVTVVLVSASSDEPDNGDGDGNTVNDIQGVDAGTADFELQLRAERSGLGDGRVYTVVYAATDEAGNSAEAAGFVVVPHDQGGGIDPLTLSVANTAAGTLIEWEAVTGAISYDVIRGDLGGIAQDVAPVIDLGTVSCIESDSVEPSTAGHEDAELPASGTGFFYLIQFDNGLPSWYGSESAGMPRVAGAGSCP